MDLTGLGASYIDDFGLGTGAVSRELNAVNNIVNRKNTMTNDKPNFEDILKRATSESAAQPEHVSPKTAAIDKTSKLYEQCLELEIFMVKTLVNSMRNTVQKSGLIDEGFAGKMYEDMLYDEYARNLTKNASFGMADLAYLELTGQRTAQHIRNE